MAGTDNLVPQSERTKAEQREIARMGGIASGKARLRKKRGRELMQAILGLKEMDQRIVDELANAWGISPDDVTKEVSMNVRQVDKAIKRADTNAFKAIHQVAGTLAPDEKGDNVVNIVISKEAAAAAEKWCK